MFTFITRSTGVVLIGGIVVASGLSALAQDAKDDKNNPFRVAPANNNAANANPPKAGFQVVGAGGVMAPVNPYSALLNNPYGVGTMTSMPSYGGGGGYGGGYGSNYYPTPWQGYFMGAADVINAQGQYLINNQQALLLREQVRRAMMENKRAAFDQWLYFQANTPTLQDERERIMREEVRRSLNDPPSTEVWSGKALNILLTSVQKHLASSGGKAAAANLPLEEDVVKKINVTSGKGGGNVGVLKNDGVLNWPLALRELPAADELRVQLDQLAKKAYDDAVKGQADGGTLKEMNAVSSRLQQVLVKNVNEIPFAQYNAAKRFLAQVDDGIKALAQPDAANYVNGRYALRGKTISEVVQHMTDNGLVFAPASAGEEAAYKALHFALTAYERAANEAVTQR